MLDWKQFFLAYLRSRSRLFIYLLSLAFLVLLFQFLFASLGIYFLYFFFLCCFVTILFFTWDILVETQVYRQELLYGEREAKSPLEIALAEKLEAREMELYQQRSKAERKLTDLLDYYTLWVHQIKTPIVFERGFSGYNGRLTQQSSGLGLYLSKKISEELGHQIRIESEVGKGTTVRIQFAQVNLVLE